MTNQDIFNKVTAHLLTQKVRSTMIAGSCAYRGENNTSCAIGCLIKDEAYSKSLEYRVYNHETVQAALIQSGLSLDGEVCELLGDLQNIHDTRAPENWEAELIKCAEKFDLFILSPQEYAKALTNN